MMLDRGILMNTIPRHSTKSANVLKVSPARPTGLKPVCRSTGGPRVVSRSFLGEGSYTTYPHMNAYGSGGRTFVYARTHDGVTRLYQRDLLRSRDTVLLESDTPLRGCWEAAWR